MKKTLTYAYLQLKRMAKLAPFIWGITILLCLCLSLALSTIINTDQSADNKRKFTVGIVGDFSDSYFGFGISAMQSLDPSRFSIEIVELTEHQAKQKLENGDIMAYVIIPDGYIDDAMHGDINKLSYVTKESGFDIAVLFKDEVLDMISCMLVESQNGIYGMQDAVRKNNIEVSDIMDHTNALMAEYLTLIINRSTAIEQKIVGISDSLSLGAYMYSGITVLLILLCGISCCPFFMRRNKALSVLLNADLCGPMYQISGEYAAYLFMTLVNTAVLFGVLIVGAGDTVAIIPELAGFTLRKSLSIFVKFIPAIIAVTSLQFLLYELTDSVISGVLLQVICAIGLAYVSGCLYPISFFPKSIQTLSALTPTGVARGYLSSLISGKGEITSALILVGYSVVLIGAAMIVRRQHAR